MRVIILHSGTATKSEGGSFLAIQLSTAAGRVAILKLFSRNQPPDGFVKQEDIPLAAFFSTEGGHRIYTPWPPSRPIPGTNRIMLQCDTGSLKTQIKTGFAIESALYK